MRAAAFEPLSGCPACDEPGRAALFAKDGWPVARCAACSLVYVDAQLDRAAVAEIYGRDYFEGDAFTDYLGERDERMASARQRAGLLAGIVPGGRLLDIGCAAGFFLEAASEHYEVTGVEVSEYASQYAREEFGHRVFTGELADAELLEGEFDVVTMWDVIEHLRDPRAALAEIARVTRAGGLLVITTGNADGPLARRDLAQWDLMHPPGHLTFFSRRTLEPLLNRAGLEVERVVADGRISRRPALVDPRAQAAAGALGLGNVMTVLARRVTMPQPRPVRSRVPTGLRRRAPLVPPSRRPADDETWLAVAATCRYATFFHTPMWRELAVEGVGGCRDASFALELPSGVRAIFPLQELLPRHGRGRYLTSTFPYGYGGPIADGTLTVDEVHGLYAGARAATTSVTGNPYAPTAAPPAGWTGHAATTQTIDLEPGYEALRRGFSKGHRAAITQAERKGVSTRVAASLDDYRGYFAVYEDSLRRWGEAASPRYPWSLFERAWQIARRWPDALRLWLAEQGGEVVAGALVLYWNGHVMYWQAAALERAFELRPANLVLANAIEDACGRGGRVFDFGSSGGHDGPEAFKRRFGATIRPLERLEYVTPPLRFTGAVRRRLGG